jgi:hypothetical protein
MRSHSGRRRAAPSLPEQPFSFAAFGWKDRKSLLLALALLAGGAVSAYVTRDQNDGTPLVAFLLGWLLAFGSGMVRERWLMFRVVAMVVPAVILALLWAGQPGKVGEPARKLPEASRAGLTQASTYVLDGWREVPGSLGQAWRKFRAATSDPAKATPTTTRPAR